MNGTPLFYWAIFLIFILLDRRLKFLRILTSKKTQFKFRITTFESTFCALDSLKYHINLFYCIANIWNSSVKWINFNFNIHFSQKQCNLLSLHNYPVFETFFLIMPDPSSARMNFCEETFCSNDFRWFVCLRFRPRPNAFWSVRRGERNFLNSSLNDKVDIFVIDSEEGVSGIEGWFVDL